MLIPLGIWAASGAGSTTATPAMELISTTILGSNTATVTFSAIASTYKHLQIRMTNRDTSSSNIRPAGIQFNGDTASNYQAHRIYGDGASVSSDYLATSYIQYKIPGNGALASVWSGAVLDILNYANTTTYKTTRMLSGFYGGNGSSEIGLYSGNWRSTSAITSVSLIALNSNAFATGSRFSLYGIKG
jgi:hypothetical protein